MFGPRSYRNEIVNTLGLVAYWRAAEANGTVLNFEEGRSVGGVSTFGSYGNTPDLAVAGALSGDPNTAVNYKSASSEYATVAGYSLPVDVITVEQWIRYPSTPGALQCFFSAQGNNVWLFVDTANKVQFWKANSAVMWTTTSTMVPDTWVHVVLTKNAAATAIYLNGTPSALTGSNATLTASSTIYLSSIDGASFFFNGTIDETAIYNRPLAAAEVARHYQLGRRF